MRDTSLSAFADLELTASQADVMAQMKMRPKYGYTRKELAAAMGKPINCICGRVRELLDQKRLIEDGKRLDRTTNKHQHVLKVANNG